MAIDLVVQSPSVSPTSVAAGATFSARCTAANTGGGSPGGCYINYYLSTDRFYTAGVDILLGSSVGITTYPTTLSTNLATPCSQTAGNYYIIFYIDPNNNVSETNESNNYIVYTAITITTGIPDLIISNPDATPSTILNGSTTTATCHVSNGGQSRSDPSTLKIYFNSVNYLNGSETLLASTAVGSISSGSWATVSQSVTLPTLTGSFPQTKYIIFQADGNNVVMECSEANNTNYKQITITLPDLIIQNPGSNPTSIPDGSNIATLSCRVTNTGSVIAGASTLKIYINDVNSLSGSPILLSSISVGSINPSNYVDKSQANVAIPYYDCSGISLPLTKYIIFVADAADPDVVDETNESNNISYVQVSITNPPNPDFAMSSWGIGWVDGSGNCGDAFPFNGPYTVSCLSPSWYQGYIYFGIDISNNDPSNAYVDVQAHIVSTSIDTYQYFDDVYVQGCSETGCCQVTGDGTGSWGGVSVTYTIDYNSQFTENNENNNVCQLVAIMSAPKFANDSANNFDSESSGMLILYPNPAYDIININSTTKMSSISLYTIYGQLVSKYEPQLENYVIDVSEIKAGLYLIIVDNDDSTTSKLIDIQH